MPARSAKHLALGQAVRTLRLRAKLSQEGLGERAGLDRTYIGGVERGERNPSFESILAILTPLKATPRELFELAEADELWS